jgi:hypothetical protein
MRIYRTFKGVWEIMPIVRNRNAVLYFATSLLICVALICGSAPASAQTTESSGEQVQEAQPISGSSPSSSDQVSEDPQQPSTRPAICGETHLGQCLKDIAHDQAGI